MKQPNIKRILAILLCVCMLAVSGCNGDSDTSDGTVNSFADFQKPGESTTSTSAVSTDGVDDTTAEGNQTGTTTAPTKGTGSKTNATTTTTKSPTTTTTKNPYLDPSVQTATNVNLAKGKTLKAGGKAVAAFTDENTTKAAFSGKNGQKATFELDLGKQCTFNEIWLYESTDNQVSEHSIYIQKGSKWVLIYKQDEIGSYRICSFPAVTAQKIKMEVTATRGAYTLTEMKVVNAGTRKANDFRVFSYITGWESLTYYGPDDMTENFAKSTDYIYIGDVTWNKDSELVYGGTLSSEAEFDEKVANIQSCIKKTGKNIRLWITIGPSQEDTVGTLQGARKEKLIKNLVAFAEKHKLAGLDFDWEYPNGTEQWHIYSEFLVDIKAALAKKGMKLSIALSPWGVQLTTEATAAVDYVQTMLYDSPDNTGNHASYNMVRNNIQYFLKLGFKRSQINMGLAFYGKKGGNQTGYSLVYALGVERWDNVCSDGSINFNGCQMIRDKTVLALYEELAGVMVWHYGCDVTESETGMSLFGEVCDVREQYLR